LARYNAGRLPAPEEQPLLGDPAAAADVRANLDHQMAGRSADYFAAREAQLRPAPAAQPLFGDAAASADVRDAHTQAVAAANVRRDLRSYARRLGADPGTQQDLLSRSSVQPAASPDNFARDRSWLAAGAAAAEGLPEARETRIRGLANDVEQRKVRFDLLDRADQHAIVRLLYPGSAAHAAAIGATSGGANSGAAGVAAAWENMGFGHQYAGQGIVEKFNDRKAFLDAQQRTYAEDHPLRALVAGTGAAVARKAISARVSPLLLTMDAVNSIPKPPVEPEQQRRPLSQAERQRRDRITSILFNNSRLPINYGLDNQSWPSP